jgi:putative membrane protein
MGFANVVPGISGGTMLLMVGVYQRFVAGVAEVSTLVLRFPSLALLTCIGLGAGLSILLSAGPIKDAVVEHRWIAFSIFIGLRLGAIPIVLKLCRPFNAKVYAGIAAGLVITALLGMAQYRGDGAPSAADSVWYMRFAAGLAGASATILPGMDGSYFLLLMGQYVPILGAIDRFKDALTAGDMSAAVAQILFLLPVACGVALGLGGVSLLLRYLFKHHLAVTGGVLMGVLVGAVFGLWPFRQPVAPLIGQNIGKLTVTADNLASIPKEDWPVAFFTPTPTQMLISLALIAAGIAIAYVFTLLDPDESHLKSTQNSST